VVAWVMTQTRSRAIDRIRFERRMKRVNPYVEAPLLEQAVGNSAQERMAHDERRRICDALSVLKPDERVAIESTFFLELSYAEAAKRLNQPLGTIKTRIRSGLAKLRQALRAEDQ
jgi:RNA polymerase sigma-70 factor, ECF subfamily